MSTTAMNNSAAPAASKPTHMRILVWDVPVRIFHWAMAASFATAFITSESEAFRSVHVTSGYLMLALIAFRVIWGFVGTRHARFTDFVRGPGAVVKYVRSLVNGNPEHHVGHNPAGALAIILLLLLGVGTVASGWMTFNEIGGDALEELHEGIASTMLAVVVVHVLGVIVSSFLHRENLVGSMFTGYKDGPREEGIRHRRGIMAIVLVAVLGWFGWGLAQGQFPGLLDANATVQTAQHGDGERDDD